MESRTTFFITQIKSQLNLNNIPYMIFQEADNPEDIQCNFSNRIYINILGNSLGHSDVNIYIGENKELIAVTLNEVTNSLLNICNLLKQLYGVTYKKVEILNPMYNKYIYYF